MDGSLRKLGSMTELLTAAQMRAIEQAAIDSGVVTGLELMERAGRGVVEAVFEEWPELAKTSHRALVLCGPGNNGGDGFVVARLLREWGWEVEVFLWRQPDKLPPDAKVNYERWSAMGAIRPIPLGVASPDARAGALIVDALFGTGLTRPVSSPDSSLSRMLPDGNLRGQHMRPRIVAIDLPSGLCSDSGRELEGGERLWADLTVTFHARKLGHVLGRGPFLCGKVVVADIGLSHQTETGRWHPGVHLPDAVAADGPARIAAAGVELRKDDHLGVERHKYSHGHALILSGGPGKGGAARLAARGALRIGAGAVTLGCPPAALQENAAQLNAIMLKPLKEVTDLIEFLADGRINAVCLGPGLGRGEKAQQLVTAVLAAERATVLDADALTVHEDDPQSLFYQLHENCVLTPHAGEFRRLFPDIAAKLDAPAATGPAFSKVDATREAAARAGCTVLFKGPDTVIADASGRCVVNSSAYDRTAPWLATAGSGDVLAGFITGLLARGLGPLAAAEAAAWLHTECARSFGPGLIAEDLPEELPKVLRGIGL
jgi:ADP-dependent NAD(P)H-hydrate dehydratase / NAD(P)H-hydrate epimerase